MNDNINDSINESTNEAGFFDTAEAKRIFSACRGSEDNLAEFLTPSALQAFARYSEAANNNAETDENRSMPEGNPLEWSDEQMKRIIKRVKLGERVSL